MKIINEHKTATIAATLTTEQYRRHFAGLFAAKEMGVYGFCFMLLALMQARATTVGGIDQRIAFVMDSGNVYADHVRKAHAALQQLQNVENLNAGPLTFDTDTNLRALQAADLISWTVRRGLTNTFGPGFEPLPGGFDAPPQPTGIP